MPVNSDKPQLGKSDIAKSVDFYNSWFMRFAPKTYRTERKRISGKVSEDIRKTGELASLTPDTLKKYPSVLPMLRMATAPPIAQDRLGGLAGVGKSLINRMEKEGKLPVKMDRGDLDAALARMCEVIDQLLDRDIFPWLGTSSPPTRAERERASTVVADRLTGALSDPIIRNAQEQRQLRTIGAFLRDRGYRQSKPAAKMPLTEMEPGTFTFRLNVAGGGLRKVTIPVDAVVQPRQPRPNRLPILIEAKSAGDFTNVNKRRKEEATKMRQLQETYGIDVSFILFLNGYFDTSYLGYEAAEGIDWVWEHRLDDLLGLGL